MFIDFLLVCLLICLPACLLICLLDCLLICLFVCLQVVAAEGEQKASRALKEAADVINESPAALQLRYLQTLNQISAEKNSTIIFPIPIDMLKGFGK